MICVECGYTIPRFSSLTERLPILGSVPKDPCLPLIRVKKEATPCGLLAHNLSLG